MGSTNKFTFFVLILSVHVIDLTGKNDFGVYFDFGSCTHNPEYVKSSNCSVDKSFDPPRAFVDIQLQRDIKTMFFSVENSMQHKKTFRKFLDIRNESACDLFDEGNFKKMKFIRKNLKMFGELPKHCPIKKDFHFLFKINVDNADIFPAFTPDGNFTVKITVNSGQDFVASYECRGAVRRK